MWHPDEGTLHALLDGELDSAESARVQAHLAGCPDCRSLMAEARELRSVARSLVETLDEAEDVRLAFAEPAATAPAPGLAPAPVSQSGLELRRAARPDAARQPAGERARRRPRWALGLAWAATVVLAVSAGYLLGGRRNPNPGPRDLAMNEAPRQTPAPISSAPPAPADEIHPDGPTGRSEPAAESKAPRALPKARPTESVEAARDPAASAPSPSRPTAPGEAARAADQARAAPPAKAIGQVSAAPGTVRDTSRAALRERMARSDLRLDELVVTAGVPSPAVSPAVDSALAKARRLLGGTVRLIDGLSPARVEIGDSLVRVHYRSGGMTLVLEQWREGEAVRTRLVAPDGTPADSIAAWTRRIR